MTRFKVEKSQVVPDKWHVYDCEDGQIARQNNGTLAYFPTRLEAKNFAAYAHQRDIIDAAQDLRDAVSDERLNLADYGHWSKEILEALDRLNVICPDGVLREGKKTTPDDSLPRHG